MIAKFNTNRRSIEVVSQLLLYIDYFDLKEKWSC